MAKTKKKTENKKKKAALKAVKYFFLILLAIILMAGALIAGAVIGAKNSAPELTSANILPTSDPTVILDDAGNEIIQLSSRGARKTEATSDEVPELLKWAYIDLEDERFYEHNGIDLKGILRAAYVTLTTDSQEGASTITQQVIKNNVFETGGSERSFGSKLKRKIQEWFLATELEKEMSKDEIILNYMNSIYLGSGNYGVKEAAQYYFGKELSGLTAAECAVIASITQNPSAYNPSRYQDENWKRASKCLRNMLKNGHITQEEYDDAINEDVYSHIIAIANQTAGSSIYSYYVDALIEQLVEDLTNDCGYSYPQAYNAIYSGGLTIYSYQNMTAQEIIDREINNENNYSGINTSYSVSWNITISRADGKIDYYNQAHMTRDKKIYYGEDWTLDFASKEEADACIDEYKAYLLREGDTIVNENVYYTLQPQASFTLMDYTTGRVLALCGGRGEKETSLSLNRATVTRRQPGSVFKITAAFAPALEMGNCTLATTFDDEPFAYLDSGKNINNWWGDSYRGLSSIRVGIRDSMNVVACKTLLYIGASNCVSFLRSFGYKSIDEADGVMSTALGGITNGVTNLENCAAFSAVANDGIYLEPLYYSKVVDKNGNVILDTSHTQDVHRVISVETASLLTNAMQDVVTSGTGVACAISSAPLAGKTGTTNDYRDLWFVGYVPNGLCSAIWVGYDENMTVDQNNEVQKAFYSAIMDPLVSALGKSGGEFTLKGNIITATICSKSGMLSNGDCSSDQAGSTLRTEYFKAGTVPPYNCFVHKTVKVCKKTGKIANKYCPETEDKVIRQRIDLLDFLNLSNYTHDGSTPDSAYVLTQTCTEHNEKTTTTTTATTTTTTTETTTEEEETTTEEEETTTDEETSSEDESQEPEGEPDSE